MSLDRIKKILAGCTGCVVAGTWRHISGANVDPRDWARVLRVRHESGEYLGVAQIDAYRAALQISSAAEVVKP